jgi:predicted transcriptional regulator
MNKEQGCAWPSYARIGTIINRSAETVRRAVRDLVKWEFLQMEKVTGRPNRYYQMHQLVGENDWQEGGR